MKVENARLTHRSELLLSIQGALQTHKSDAATAESALYERIAYYVNAETSLVSLLPTLKEIEQGGYLQHLETCAVIQQSWPSYEDQQRLNKTPMKNRRAARDEIYAKPKPVCTCGFADRIARLTRGD